MDLTKDEWAGRLDKRNSQKERTSSVPDGTEEKKYKHFAATIGDDYGSVPDSFAPTSFSGSNADADSWLAHFQRYTEYTLSQKMSPFLFLR